MAWRNFPISGMEDLQGEITDFSLLNRLTNNWTMGTYDGDFTFKWLNLNSVNIGSFLFGDSTNGFKYESKSSGKIPYVFCQGYLNSTPMDYGGQICFQTGSGVYPSQNYYFTFYCCVDDSTQKAYLFALTASIERSSTKYNCSWSAISQYMNSSECYQLVTGFPIITYQWQSVPSISGKNGILSLSQAKASALNNGEPVSSASASDFDSLTAQVSTLVTDDSQMAGKEAGGISGSGDNSADQTTGYAFGQGESGTNISGGGSGLYGGYKSTSSNSGGAGSGYIGNSLVNNKKMVGYNVPTSDAEGTKTESVNDVSASAVSGKPKSGNGFAKIKLLSTSQDYNFTDIIKTLDMTHIKHTSGNISNLSEYYLTDWILNSGINSQQTLTYNDGVFAISDGGGIVSYPITRLNGVSKVTFKARRTNHSVSFDGCFFNVINGVRTVVGSFSGSLNTDWKTFTVTIDNKIVDYFEVYAGGGYGDNVQISDVVFTSV